MAKGKGESFDFVSGFYNFACTKDPTRLFALPASIQGVRSRSGMSLQSIKSALFDLNRKGSAGTLLMPVLSQIMRARDTEAKEAL